MSENFDDIFNSRTNRDYESSNSRREKAVLLMKQLVTFYQDAPDEVRQQVLKTFDTLRTTIGFDGANQEIFDLARIAVPFVALEGYGAEFINLLYEIFNIRSRSLTSDEKNSFLIAIIYGATVSTKYDLAHGIIEEMGSIAPDGNEDVRDTAHLWLLNMAVARHSLTTDQASLLEQVFARTKSLELKSKVSSVLARHYNQRREHSKAVPHAIQALFAGRKQNDYIAQLCGSFELGVALIETGEVNRGLKWLARARRTGESVNDVLRVRAVIMEEIRYSITTKKTDEAISRLNNLLPQISKFPDTEAQALYYLGAFHLQTKSYNQALTTFNRVLPRFETTEDKKGDPYWYTATVHAVGLTYSRMKKRDDAVWHLGHARKLARGLEDSPARQHLLNEINKDLNDARGL